jgi:predicted transcriptional regulator
MYHSLQANVVCKVQTYITSIMYNINIAANVQAAIVKIKVAYAVDRSFYTD